MKKILLIFAVLVYGIGHSQSSKVNAVLFDTITSTERDAMTIENSRVGFLYNETTGQFEANVKNLGWNSLVSTLGALTTGAIDTFAKLDAIVADATLAKSGDNVSIFTNDVPYLTSSSLTDYALLTGGPTTQTFGQNINAFTNVTVSGVLVGGEVQVESKSTPTNNVNGNIYYDSDTNQILGYVNGSYVDLGAIGGGSSPPFDDNSPHIRDNVDNSKTITLIADNITTATNRNLKMPNADVDLGALTASNLTTNSVDSDEIAADAVGSSEIDLTANYDWSGTNTFDSTIRVTKTGASSGVTIYETDDVTQVGVLGDFTSDIFGLTHGGSSIGIRKSNNVLTYNGFAGGGNLTVNVDNNGDFYTSALPTDDQTASEVAITDAAGYYTGTDVEAMGQEIGTDLADRPTSLGTGRTNPVQYSDIYGQALADYNTDGAGGAGDLIVITDASPAEVVSTATIAMDGWKMYDDQTADAATITLSDCDPGETLTVYINRASAPTLAGTGLTFNPLPNTTAFASATQMMIIFEVAYDGTTIDYYYVER